MCSTCAVSVSILAIYIPSAVFIGYQLVPYVHVHPLENCTSVLLVRAAIRNPGQGRLADLSVITTAHSAPSHAPYYDVHIPGLPRFSACCSFYSPLRGVDCPLCNSSFISLGGDGPPGTFSIRRNPCRAVFSSLNLDVIQWPHL
jgi:hypothetical protein